MCKKCSCNLIPLRLAEILAKGSLTMSSLTWSSYRNKALHPWHSHLQRFHGYLLLLVLCSLMSWQMTNKTLYCNFYHCLVLSRSFDTVIYTTNLKQRNKLFQFLLCNFKNNISVEPCVQLMWSEICEGAWTLWKISLINVRWSSWFNTTRTHFLQESPAEAFMHPSLSDWRMAECLQDWILSAEHRESRALSLHCSGKPMCFDSEHLKGKLWVLRIFSHKHSEKRLHSNPSTAPVPSTSPWRGWAQQL